MKESSYAVQRSKGLYASLTGCANNSRREITDKDIDGAISALDNYGKNPPSDSKSNLQNKHEHQPDLLRL